LHNILHSHDCHINKYRYNRAMQYLYIIRATQTTTMLRSNDTVLRRVVLRLSGPPSRGAIDEVVLSQPVAVANPLSEWDHHQQRL
jgi:hypothetical protein